MCEISHNKKSYIYDLTNEKIPLTKLKKKTQKVKLLIILKFEIMLQSYKVTFKVVILAPLHIWF